MWAKRLLMVNAILLLIVFASHWARFSAAFHHAWALLTSWLGLWTLLFIYGVALIYLLVVVHLLRNSRPRRRQRRLVPYYGDDGILHGFVRAPNTPPGFSQPFGSRRTPISASSSVVQNPLSLISGSPALWDGWPDGAFEWSLDRDELKETNHLPVHWVSSKLPGGRHGSVHAITPSSGKLTRYKCLGTLQCRSSVCSVHLQIPPSQDLVDMRQQLQVSCLCGAPLHYVPCSVEWSVSFYLHGAVFENSGKHSHSYYTHSIPIRNGAPPQLTSLPTHLCRRLVELSLHTSCQKPAGARASNRHGEGFDISENDEPEWGGVQVRSSRSNASIDDGEDASQQPEADYHG
ncbi:hypothetical protein GGX14DRAFT_473192 [Mycena pura]|uniref:Uncharacterized protein n=1 Tax=Mycena pura TaxID=153505 RepID=A0AAD6V0I1_9AGAR|nr:hypothetical protein GGX14DRAFT_473192 [Mycena pura]